MSTMTMKQELAMTFLRGTFNAFQSCTQKLGQEANTQSSWMERTEQPLIQESFHPFIFLDTVSRKCVRSVELTSIRERMCMAQPRRVSRAPGRPMVSNGNTTAYARGPVKGA